MRSLEVLLEESVALHGHLCSGQVLGVRMAMLGCREVGIEEPAVSKDLLVYVEIDRCAADAIQTVTGCKLGKRTLKFFDYGKVACTFVNTKSGRAFRVVATEGSRVVAREYAPAGLAAKAAQLSAYKVMPEDIVFDTMAVGVDVPAADLPGHPTRRIICDACAEGVNDAREVAVGHRLLCKPCAEGGYYRLLQDGRQSAEVA